VVTGYHGQWLVNDHCNDKIVLLCSVLAVGTPESCEDQKIHNK